MEMKSKKIMKKVRLDEYVEELCNRPVSKKKFNRHMKGERVHARMAAKLMSRTSLERYINKISKRLYENGSSAVPSDLGLFKAARN